VADDSAGRLRDLVAKRRQRMFFLELLVQVFDLQREAFGIQRIEGVDEIRGRNRRAIERIDGLGVPHR